ncbi:hypothetical protein MK489_21805 [Myxococcota bacterium]|nr:hypothetical protein [Myxococcota bacterium]
MRAPSVNRRRFLISLGLLGIGCLGGVSAISRLRWEGFGQPKELDLLSKLSPVADPHFSGALERVATTELLQSLVARGVLTPSGVDFDRLALACSSDEIESFASRRYARTELELYALAARIVA